MDPLTLMDALPDGELRDKLVGMGFTTVEALAEGYSSQNRTMSSSTRVPGANASDEDRARYYRAIGRPDSVDGYEIPQSSDAGFTRIMGALRTVAHTEGLSTKQFAALAAVAANETATMNTEVQSGIQQRSAGWHQKAKDQYGDKLDDVVAQGKRIIDQLAEQDPELKSMLESSGLGNHPAMLGLMSQIGEITGGGTVPTGMPQQESHMEDAITEARKLVDRSREIVHMDAFSDKNKPEHRSLIDEMYRGTKRLLELGFTGVTDPKLAETYANE